LSYSKTLVDQINIGKECPRELKEIQYLIFAGMISYYGFEEIELLHKVFKNTGFIYTHDSFDKFAKSANFHDERIEKLLKNGDVGAFVNCRVSSDLLGRIYVKRDIHVIDNGKDSPDIFLEKVIHEVNHVVNSINHSVCIMNEKKALRTGLYVASLEGKDSMGNLCEEAYNVLQTAEIMDEILAFTQYDVKDPDIKRALDKIKFAYGKKREGTGYQYTVSIFRDLYNNAHFRHLVKRQRMSGIIKPVRLDFDERCGEGSYRQFCDILDKIEVSSHLFWERQFHENSAKTFIKKYNAGKQLN
jgi:hypothetical protein